MCGVVLRHDRGPDARIGHRVAMATRRHGAIVRPLGDTIVLMPPLAMTAEEIRAVVTAVGAALAEVLG